MSGVVFDTGALLALERGDRTVLVLIHAAREDHETITVPAGCVAQAWRAPARQARVAAHVALCGIRRRQLVVTSDPGDIRRLAPGLAVHRV